MKQKSAANATKKHHECRKNRARNRAAKRSTIWAKTIAAADIDAFNISSTVGAVLSIAKCRVLCVHAPGSSRERREKEVKIIFISEKTRARPYMHIKIEPYSVG